MLKSHNRRSKLPVSETKQPDLKLSNTYQVVPTLVLGCGALSDVDFQSIKIGVEDRIGLHLPQEFVHWDWEPIQSDEEVTEELVSKVTAPFLTLDFVEEMNERGYIKYLPDQKPLEFQIVVIHERSHSDSDGAVSSKFLETLGSAINKRMAGRVKLSLVLVAIGDGPLELNSESPFSPRFRLGSITLGWMAAKKERILEDCQNLVINLVASELVLKFKAALKKEQREAAWIWVGASAVVVDVAGMQDYVRLSALGHLVHPVVEYELTPAGRQFIEQSIEQGVQAVKVEHLRQVQHLLGASKHNRESWQIDLRKEDTGRFTARISRIVPSFPLWRTLRMFLANPYGLAVELRNHYKLIRDELMRELRKTVLNQYDVLCKQFEASIEPPSQKDESWKLDEPLPFGLAAALHAVQFAGDSLLRSPDAMHRDWTYQRSGSDDYLGAVATEDATVVSDYDRQYRRNERLVLSPWGFLLKLIPAWPLLAAVLVRLFQWSDLGAGLVALLLLSLLATGEYVYVQQYFLRSLWLGNEGVEGLRIKIERTIGDSTFGLATKVLRDYRLMMASRLKEVAWVLQNLYILLQKIDLECRRRVHELQIKFIASGNERGSVYWLSDLQTCSRWVDTIEKEIHVSQCRSIFKNLITWVVSSHMFRNERPPSHLQIYDRIQTIAQHAVNTVSNPRLEFFGEEEDNGESSLSRPSQSELRIEERTERAKRITAADALRRLIDNQSIYLDANRRQQVNGTEALAFLGYNELDICVLSEREEQLQQGKIWRWLYDRAVPLGGAQEAKPFAFLTVEHDSVWDVTAFGKNSSDWQSVEEGFIVTRSVLANEIGCVRTIVEFV